MIFDFIILYPMYKQRFLQVLENPKVTKRGVAQWLMEGSEARWMVDDAFLDILDWMKKKYPNPMYTEADSTFGSMPDDDAESEGHDSID